MPFGKLLGHVVSMEGCEREQSRGGEEPGLGLLGLGRVLMRIL